MERETPTLSTDRSRWKRTEGGRRLFENRICRPHIRDRSRQIENRNCSNRCYSRTSPLYTFLSWSAILKEHPCTLSYWGVYTQVNTLSSIDSILCQCYDDIIWWVTTKKESKKPRNEEIKCSVFVTKGSHSERSERHSEYRSNGCIIFSHALGKYLKRW